MQPLWDVIGKRWIGYILSALLIIPGVVALVTNAAAGRGAVNWGVDFTGGNYLQVRFERAASIADIRAVVDRFTSGQSIIQRSEQDTFIRTRPLTPDERKSMLEGLRQQFGAVTVLREDEVGPLIGEELRYAATVGVVIGLILQLVYITIRFRSVRYAVAADAALLHDMLIVIGVFAFTRKEVNGPFVAVLLTILGYSINDKIVLYDRIRENVAQRTKEAFDRMVNRSLLESLVRSLNTSVTVVLAIAAVYFFGGVTIRDLAFGLTIGVVISTYSSVFTAGALMVDWQLWSERRAGRTQSVQVDASSSAPPSREPALEPVTSEAPVRTTAGQTPRRRRSRRR
jgi:preprotein translocase subunit SecF